MNRTIVVNDVEPAPLSLRWPLGINLDLKVKMLNQNGTARDPTLSQFVLMPRSRGGVIPYDMDAYDVANGIARIEVPGTILTDRSGYNLELYTRRANAVPGDPPVPTGLAAKGVLATEGGAYTNEGPLGLVNAVIVVGPAGPAGVAGAPGPAGTRGSIWTTGVGAPTGTGSELPGDMYLNESNGDVYRWSGTTWMLGAF